MKKTLFILAALSCSFGGLGDFIRPLYDKNYKAMYSTKNNIKEFIIGAPLSIGIGVCGLTSIVYGNGPEDQVIGPVLMICSYVLSSATNCFGSTPATYIVKDDQTALGHRLLL